VRGAGRQSASARSKSSASPLRNRAAPAKPGPPASARLSIPPRFVYLGAGLAILAALAVAGATDHRAERLLATAGDGFIQTTADMGFTLDDVRLDGASPQARPDILRAAALPRGAALLAIDLDATRKRIEQVGWVKSAKVERLFPGSVVIAIDERHLTAVWEHAGRVSVVDAGGVVAPEADPGHFSNLPLVVGEGANVAAAAILPHVMSRPRLAQHVDAFVRVDGRRWDLRLKDGAIVQLPANDEEAALIRLDQLDQQSRILDLGFSRIDLRDPEMVAVRPRQTPPATVVSDGNG
jgi:cell division protein FtsQ